MTAPATPLVIRDLQSIDDLRQLEAVEREVWGASDSDTMPLLMAIALREAGNLFLGAFEGSRMAGFAFGFFGREHGQINIHSHMLAVRPEYRDTHVGFRLKLAQRERAQALGIHEITWTFDPLQSRNANLNFARLGVFSTSYRIDFYGTASSSALHRNGTDRLWVQWPLGSSRVRHRIDGRDFRMDWIDALAHLHPLVRFDASGAPRRGELAAAVQKQRLAIEVPSNIGEIEEKDASLSREWREATRWAFREAMQAGFFVAEFVRAVRGNQGPGAYILMRGPVAEYVPEY